MQVDISFNDHGLIKQFEDMPTVIDKAVEKGVNMVTAEARKEVVGAKGLTKYEKHKRGTPTPSPPGEPPAQVSMDLRRSVRAFPAVKIGHGKYSGYVEPVMPYARYQELGTATMPARPFMRPAKDRMMENHKALRIFRRVLFVELKIKHG